MERDIIELWKENASLKARMDAVDRAAGLLARQLDEYKRQSNEWRGALSDQRATYVTRSEVVTIVGIMLTVVGLLVGLILRVVR